MGDPGIYAAVCYSLSTIISRTTYRRRWVKAPDRFIFTFRLMTNGMHTGLSFKNKIYLYPAYTLNVKSLNALQKCTYYCIDV